jgi:HTH-type transcriptional regulator/antitoxin HigA
MITNEREYKITLKQIERFRKAIEDFDLKTATDRLGSKILAKAELEAMSSEFENLSEQVREYEAVKSGTIETLKATTLSELPTILIKARIAKGLTQKQLAEKLGLHEQQIQRYEADNYATAKLDCLSNVAEALDLTISEIAEFKPSDFPGTEPNKSLPWDMFPIKDMYRRRWFEDYPGTLKSAIDNAEELVSTFVREVLPEEVPMAARQRVRIGSTANPCALIAWECRVLHLAQKEKPIAEYKRKNLTDHWFMELAQLSAQPDGPKQVKDYLSRSGISLIIEPHLPQTHLDGAAFLLSKDRPVVGMTLRYDRLDNFWFVLFHELVHILKHLHKGQTERILDDLDVEINDIEQETDQIAGNLLIPDEMWKNAMVRYYPSNESIVDFANELEISQAIVAGRIRRELDNYMIFADMVGQGKVRKLFPESTNT